MHRSTPPGRDRDANSLVPTAGRDPREELAELGPDRANLVAVIAEESVDDWASAWRASGARSPGNLGVIDITARTRSASTAGEVSTPGEFSLVTVRDSGDLAAIGDALDEFLSEWRHDGAPTVVLFRALPTLLDHADRRRVFRFLDTVMRRVEDAGAVARYYVDPDANDPDTVETLEWLFAGIEGEGARA